MMNTSWLIYFFIPIMEKIASMTMEAVDLVMVVGKQKNGGKSRCLQNGGKLEIWLWPCCSHHAEHSAMPENVWCVWMWNFVLFLVTSTDQNSSLVCLWGKLAHVFLSTLSLTKQRTDRAPRACSIVLTVYFSRGYWQKFCVKFNKFLLSLASSLGWACASPQKLHAKLSFSLSLSLSLSLSYNHNHNIQ